LHPVTDRPIHINFIKFEKSEKVRAKVKLNFINKEKSKGLKKGGFLNITLRRVELICDPNSIPDFIEIDTQELKVGDKVKVTDLILPENTKLSKRNPLTVASITGRGTKDTEENTAAAEAGGSEKKETKADDKDTAKK